MKLLKSFCVAFALLAVAFSGSAQVRIGPRVGINTNKLSFDSELFDASNRVGYNAGLELEVMIPAVNLGFDLSVMYVRRNAQFLKDNNLTDIDNDYIEIPLNLKYKIGLPIVGNIVSPYIFTGPSIAFLTSKEDIQGALKNKKCDFAWNFGVGVQLFKHLQVGASYGLGLTKAVHTIDDSYSAAGIEGKNRYWTVTAAWLF